MSGGRPRQRCGPIYVVGRSVFPIDNIFNPRSHAESARASGPTRCASSQVRTSPRRKRTLRPLSLKCGSVPPSAQSRTVCGDIPSSSATSRAVRSGSVWSVAVMACTRVRGAVTRLRQEPDRAGVLAEDDREDRGRPPSHGRERSSTCRRGGTCPHSRRRWQVLPQHAQQAEGEARPNRQRARGHPCEVPEPAAPDHSGSSRACARTAQVQEVSLQIDGF